MENPNEGVELKDTLNCHFLKSIGMIVKVIKDQE
jgi:hypothetical protein